jgi:plastocyanin
MSRDARVIVSVLIVAIVLLAASCAPAPVVAPTSPPAAAPTAASVPPTPTSVATTPTASASAGLPSCAQGRLALSLLQTPVPVTPAPTVAPTLAPTLNPSGPTATPRPPTATPLPAPQIDRVGFPPDNYQDSFRFLYVFDRTDTKQVRVVCGNDVAASVKEGQPFPYGSVIVFESWRPKEDSSSNAIKDANGHLIREVLTTLFVMRKEKGYGEAYQNLRNGEWEYVAYRPDKSLQTPPQLSSACASCHLGAGQDRDFVFHPNLIFAKDHYAQTPPVGQNELEMSSMTFFPRTLTMKPGTTLKWTNNDVTTHTVTANDKTFDSGNVAPGSSFIFKFDKPGIYDFKCTLHPNQMTGRIEVKE